MVPSSELQKNKKIVRETISQMTGCRQALPPPAKRKQARQLPPKTLRPVCSLLKI
jgi:hypothetical protein